VRAREKVQANFLTCKRRFNPEAHYNGKYPFMFDWSLDPKGQLALLCLFTAFFYWNNDILFFLFAIMAVCTRVTG
jgi:hypothetical protein